MLLADPLRRLVPNTFTSAIAAKHGLDASVERETQRIPHRVRAQRAADRGGQYFEMSGPWVVAIGVPPHPLAVTCERHDFGGNVGARRSNVTIEVHDGESASSERIGDSAWTTDSR